MKKRYHYLITFPILMVLGSTLFFLFLPYLFDLYLFPQLIAKLPYTEKELSLSRLSLWKIRGTLTLADEDRSTLSIPRFELTYTPSSLLQGKIAGLFIDSASLQLEMQGGYPVIRGLPLDNSPDMPADKTSSFLLPLAVETVILNNCSITLYRELQKPIVTTVNGRFSLGFLEQPDNKKLLSTLSGQIQVTGDLSFSGEFGLKSENNEDNIHLQLQSPDIAQLSQFSPVLKDVQLSGGFFLSGQAKFDQMSSQITEYEATVKLPGFQFKKNDLIFENISEEVPVLFQSSGNLEKAQYALSNIILAKPEKTTLELNGEFKILEKTFNGIGQLFFARTNSTVNLNYQGANHLSETKISYQLVSDTFNIGEAINISSLTADGNVAIKDSVVTATLNSRIPKITLKKSQTELVNLSLQLPFQYPPLAKGTSGKLRIDKIKHQGVNSGKLRATLIPSTEGIAFTTLFTSPFVPHLRLACKGSAQLTTDFNVGCRLPETKLDSSTFPDFIKLPDKLSFKGKLSADGEFHITDKIAAGKLTVDYRDGTLIQGENELSNINIGVVFPHLPLLQSSPGQLCTIGSLNLGKIKLSDARIRFRIEDDQAIFLEKSRLSWCGGKVETGGFTLSKDMKELETTLYCDRLGFTELLAQFGIDQTEGQGSLNGRLPILISNKRLAFDDGFLFSTPGNSGIVRFNDTKQLRQGIPDINKSAYLDYSMKALENFSYNWTKLSFNSLENDLLITMQLDGKPAEPLPFGYKKGQIIPSSKGPGLQHPIRLDVNFRLPLQDLFQYGNNIQSIMENM